MGPDTFTLYKLIILKMMKEVDFSLSNAQICSFILDKDYTNYFNVQQALNEMLDAELILCETTHNTSYYRLTALGEETLEFFGNQIPEVIQNDILSYLQEKKYALREEVSVQADYYEEQKDRYTVCCKIMDHGAPLMELVMAASSEDEAARMVDMWKKKNKKIYESIYTSLMVDQPEE